MPLREAATTTFKLYKGKLFDLPLTWKIDDVAVNLTDYDALFTMKDTSATTTIIELSTTADVDGNVITLGGAAGTITVTIKTAKTTTFTPGPALFELELVQPDGEHLPFLRGTIEIVDEVTT